MTKRNILHCFMVGILISLLVFPPMPAQAQFLGGIVFDPRALAEQIKKRLEDAKRWVDTIKYYQEMYTQAVEQHTTLRGVLKTVDTQLFKNQQAALLANDIAEIISDSQKLKRQLDGMLRYQITFLKNIDDRLEQGIFDPDADMRDLQNWLLYTMGRDARQTVDQLMRYVGADTELASWRAEREKLGEKLVAISKKRKANVDLLDRERNAPIQSQYNIEQLNQNIAQLDKEADELQKRITELTNKINQRIKDWGLRLSDMENFAKRIDANEQMWKELRKTQADMERTMNEMILNPPQFAQ
jgi:flagellar biosynthesis chaperone FliJ